MEVLGDERGRGRSLDASRDGDGLIEARESRVQGHNLGVVPAGDVAFEDLRQQARVEIDFAVRRGHGVEKRDAADDEGHLDELCVDVVRVCEVIRVEGNVSRAEVVVVAVSGTTADEIGLARAGA